MTSSGFRKLFWGFLFILIDIPIMKIDILPDTIGYIFFLLGFKALAKNSSFFIKGKNVSIIMTILSILIMYQQIMNSNKFSLIHFELLEKLTIPISCIALILEIYMIYNLFMGIKEMCEQKENSQLYEETEDIWVKYIYLTIGFACSIFVILIPVVGIIFLVALAIASIILFFKIMKLMKRCEYELV
ncbi:hypothetical protein [Clostridium sp. JNZ J1-5]